MNIRIFAILVCSALVYQTSSAEILQQVDEKTKRGLLQRLEDNADSKMESAFQKQQEWSQKLWDYIQRLHLQTGVQGSLDLLDGLGLGIQYKYKVKPAHVGGYFVRSDGYIADADVSPLAWFMENSKPVFVNINPQTEVYFYQLYPTQSEAVNPLNGHFISDIPFTAERALTRLRPGDMVLMNTMLNLNMGLGGNWVMGAGFESEGKVGFVMRGQFNVFVFRGDGHRVRVRIAKRKAKQIGVSGEVGIKDDIGLFGYELADNKIVKWLNLDEIVKVYLGGGNQNIILADYTMDLSYPEVQQAYNNLLSSSLMFKGVQPDNEELKDVFIADLNGLNEIYQQDLGNPVPQPRRVVRNFLGSNWASKQRTIKGELQLTRLVEFSRSLSQQESHLTRFTMGIEGDEAADYFTFPTFSEHRESDADIFGFHEEEFKNSDIIFTADKDFNLTNFLSMGFYYEYRDSSYKNKEHVKFLNRLKMILPPLVYSELTTVLRDRGLLELKENIYNTRVSARYFINSEGMRELEARYGKLPHDVAFEVIRTKIIEHLRVNTPPKNPFTFRWRGCGDRYDNENSVVKYYCQDVDQVSWMLALISNPDMSYNDRNHIMQQLFSQKLFKKMGPGFIFKLLPENDHLADLCRFEFRFFLPSEIEPLTFIYGSTAERELYETILDIQNLMNDLEPDMRLDGTVDDLTHRRTDP